MINGLDCIFKLTSGNSDWDPYEKLIKEMQDNQNNLTTNVKIQNTVSKRLIDKFEETIRQDGHNEQLLQTKLSQNSALS